MDLFESGWSFVKGFLLGNLVLAALVYLDYWWKRQEQGKVFEQKRLILNQMHETEIQKLTLHKK